MMIQQTMKKQAINIIIIAKEQLKCDNNYSHCYFQF